MGPLMQPFYGSDRRWRWQQSPDRSGRYCLPKPPADGL